METPFAKFKAQREWASGPPVLSRGVEFNGVRAITDEDLDNIDDTWWRDLIRDRKEREALG